MLKNAYFWKNCKKPLQRQSIPRTPVCLRRLGVELLVFLFSPTITTLSSSFLALNVFYSPQKEKNNYSKCFAFASSALLHLFFTSNSPIFYFKLLLQILLVFVVRGRKNIFCPRAQGTLATPLGRSSVTKISTGPKFSALY